MRLQEFFSKKLVINVIVETENSVNIRLESTRSKYCVMSLCRKLLSKHRATYNRKA